MLKKLNIAKKLLFLTSVTSLLISCGNSKKETMNNQTETKRNLFVFFGAPGCGKGTLAQRAAKELNFTTLSTGDLCRQNIEKGTDLGKELKSFLDRGALVPDEIVSNMVKVWLGEQLANSNPIILDGYPRTKAQAETLIKLLEEPKLKTFNLKVVKISIAENSVVDRISNRVVCENKKCQVVYSLKAKPPVKEGICDSCGSKLIKRKDDSEEIVRSRFKTYQATESEILNFFKEHAITINDISAEQPINNVFEDFKKIIK